MAPRVITLDSSGLIAMLNFKNPDHDRVQVVVLSDPGPFVVPAGILSEVAYLIEERCRFAVLDDFLADLDTGELTLDCGDQDLPRLRYLVRRYADLPLGFADAAVIACAERRAGRVLTLDRRHFGVVAREGTISLLPE